jgi:hypothetical protein
MSNMELTMLLVGIGSLLGIVGLLAWETTTAFRKKMKLIEQLHEGS